MSKSEPSDDAKRELVLSLTPEERGALPARLRALAADKATIAWNEAKAERDAALEAAYAIEDPDERTAAAEAARAAWADFKASALAEG